MKGPLKIALDTLYPPRCPFCRRLLDKTEKRVCRFCRKRYEGSVVRREVKNTLGCVAPFSYRDEVRLSIIRYKFWRAAIYGEAYAEFLAKCIDESGFSCDIITWVPLSRVRLFSRGYDQARILAEATARNLGLPAARLLKKTRHTRPQSGLASAAQRRKNASGAYCCIAPETARGKTVLLIDDIVTSGATMAECAAVLKAAGCAGVYAAAAASR